MPILGRVKHGPLHLFGGRPMLIDEVASRLKDYPPYSQEGRDDPIVACKLFNAFGSGTWYLTEYDPTVLTPALIREALDKAEATRIK
jgi:hypothetical protein